MFEIRNGLTWADWCYTSQHKLALRHLDNSNRIVAEKELKNNGTGDACSLVIPQVFRSFYKSDLSEDNDEVEKIVNSAIEKLLKDRSASALPKLRYKDTLGFYQSKLQQCTKLSQKKDYLTAIFNLFLADWIRSCQQREENSKKDFYFLVIEHPDAHHPYDFRAGYALGKCGTGVPWKVHHKMSDIFTFKAENNYEDNFNSLVGRIQSFRIDNANRQFPNPVEEPRNNSCYVIAIAVAAIIWGFWNYSDNIKAGIQKVLKRYNSIGVTELELYLIMLEKKLKGY